MLRDTVRSVAAVVLITATLAGCADPGPGVTANARVTANPNPVPGNGELATTKISWSTADGSWGQVFLSHNGGPEQLYMQGPEGSADAPWIGRGRYEFRLYAGQDHQHLLAAVTVQRQEMPPSKKPVARPSPPPPTR